TATWAATDTRPRARSASARPELPWRAPLFAFAAAHPPSERTAAHVPAVARFRADHTDVEYAGPMPGHVATDEFGAHPFPTWPAPALQGRRIYARRRPLV